MRYRWLGNTGVRVAELCLGTMTFGASTGFGADRETSRAVFDRYLAAGGNFIDTADVYGFGESERWLGEFVQSERRRLVIASKFTLNTDAADPNAGGSHRKRLKEGLAASLARLKLDYLDLLWVHAYDGVTQPAELVRALDDVVRAGLVLYVGMSNTPTWFLAECNAIARERGLSPFVALQAPYGLTNRGVERELKPYTDIMPMTLTAWSPLAGGLLTGKYTRGVAAEATGRLATTGWGRLYLTERNLAIARGLDAIADRLGASSAQLALAWLLSRGPRVVPLMGARTVAQLDEQLGAADVTLSAEVIAELDALSQIDVGYPQDLLARPYFQKLVWGEHLP